MDEDVLRESLETLVPIVLKMDGGRNVETAIRSNEDLKVVLTPLYFVGKLAEWDKRSEGEKIGGFGLGSQDQIFMWVNALLEYFGQEQWGLDRFNNALIDAIHEGYINAPPPSDKVKE